MTLVLDNASHHATKVTLDLLTEHEDNIFVRKCLGSFDGTERTHP